MLTRLTKSIQIGSAAFRQYPRLVVHSQIKQFSDKADETTTKDSGDGKTEPTVKLSSFAKAFDELEKINETPVVHVENVPFKKLLRQSNLVDLGDPVNKLVKGKIIHMVGDDLYIDFGWKFNCVCVRPSKNGEAYVRGATVKLRIKELELSTLFLGEEKDLTILEADCVLLGLISSPKKTDAPPNKSRKNPKQINVSNEPERTDTDIRIASLF